jgi:hypothetical protein
MHKFIDPSLIYILYIFIVSKFINNYMNIDFEYHNKFNRHELY